MTRVFLDANVLFSAAYKEGSGFDRLLRIEGVKYVTSACAAAEAKTNLTQKGRVGLGRLEKLLVRITLVSEASQSIVPRSAKLASKDHPILAAAISAKAEYLLTGDVRHFGHLLKKKVHGATVLLPRQFLEGQIR